MFNLSILLPVVLLIVVFATLAIFALKKWTGSLKTALHKDAQIDAQLKFQGAQLVLALAVLAAVYLINPGNFAAFFRPGDVNAPAAGIAWLAIPPGTAWLEIAATIGLWITLGTAIFMGLQLKKANAKFSRLPAYLPWVMLFSAVNAFVEESIFRVGIVAPLYGQLATPILLLFSGIAFGIPHYFGMPKGIAGMLMAGFLGWLLAMSMVETQGMLLAWAVHFVQDVVIIASVFLIHQPATAAPAPAG